MKPGEGSAAPKATVALPGTDVNPAGRAPARLAVHCSLATRGSGGGHETCTLWPPPAPFGYFPVMESTSSARRRTKPPIRNRFLVADKGKRFLAFSCFLADFASAEATKGLSARPLETFGPLQQRGGAKKQISCGWQGKDLPYFFPFYRGFRLCGGDQRAFRSPFGNLRTHTY